MTEKSFILIVMMALAGSTIFCIYVTSPVLFEVSTWYNRSYSKVLTFQLVNFETSRGPDNKTKQSEKSKHSYRSEFLIEPQIRFDTECDLSCGLKDAYAWTMVVFVKSTAESHTRREFLRRTWASVRHTQAGRFAFVFIVGSSNNQTVQLIAEEASRYGDILMFRGLDDYRHVNRKTLAGMQWASEKLPPNYYYSSGDEDMIVDMALLEDAVHEGKATQERNRWPSYPIVCMYHVNPWAQVVRDPSSKYYISPEVYPWHAWPRACLGGLYTTNVDLISKLWESSNNEQLVYMDDVWITGILRQKIGLPEYAVVQPKQAAAEHFSGYEGYGNPKSRTFMAKEWDAAYKLLSERDHCRCLT